MTHYYTSWHPVAKHRWTRSVMLHVRQQVLHAEQLQAQRNAEQLQAQRNAEHLQAQQRDRANHNRQQHNNTHAVHSQRAMCSDARSRKRKSKEGDDRLRVGAPDEPRPRVLGAPDDTRPRAAGTTGDGRHSSSPNHASSISLPTTANSALIELSRRKKIRNKASRKESARTSAISCSTTEGSVSSTSSSGVNLQDAHLRTLLSKISPTTEILSLINMTYFFLQQCAQQAFACAHPKVHPSGSFRQQTCIVTSDLDVTVELETWHVKSGSEARQGATRMLRVLQAVIEGHPGWEIKQVLEAAVPVLKMVYKKKLYVDVTMIGSDIRALKRDEVILDILNRCNPIVRDSVKLVKYWACCHGVNSAHQGGLNSLSWTMLVIAYVQHQHPTLLTQRRVSVIPLCIFVAEFFNFILRLVNLGTVRIDIQSRRFWLRPYLYVPLWLDDPVLGGSHNVASALLPPLWNYIASVAATASETIRRGLWESYSVPAGAMVPAGITDRRCPLFENKAGKSTMVDEHATSSHSTNKTDENSDVVTESANVNPVLTERAPVVELCQCAHMYSTQKEI